MQAVLVNLAEHEFEIGRFYYRFGVPLAAIERFTYMLSAYPQYKEQDKVLYNLGLAYVAGNQDDNAVKTFGLLREQYPKSPYVQQIPDVKASKAPEPTQPAKAGTGAQAAQ
jgi:outer membrane protein assembly factor BamD (BamD/ComL family)